MNNFADQLSILPIIITFPKEMWLFAPHKMYIPTAIVAACTSHNN
jgi:hypothetical protein